VRAGISLHDALPICASAVAGRVAVWKRPPNGSGPAPPKSEAKPPRAPPKPPKSVWKKSEKSANSSEETVRKVAPPGANGGTLPRSEEHTSELQSREK